MATPSWLAATAGQPPLANQVNQFLGTHAITFVYTGAEKDNQSTAGAGATNSNGLFIAQSFMAGSSYAAARLVLTLAVTGTPAPLSVTVQSNAAGAPSGTVLAGPVPVPSSFVTGSAAAISLPLSVALASGTVYWIVAAAVGDVSDFYAWSKSNQVTGTSTSPTGSTWTAQAYGSLFQVWDNSVVAPLAHTWEDAGSRWITFTRNANTTVKALDEYNTAQAGGYFQSARSFTYSGNDLTAVT